MQIRVGYRMTYEFEQPTPLIAVLNVHYSRSGDLAAPDTMITTPSVAYDAYRDSFGNWCNRMVAPPGRFVMTADTVVRDTGLPDHAPVDAVQHAVERLPSEALLFLMPSRYCESDQLVGLAWELFGDVPEGWPRVQAISAWVHERIVFDHEAARPTKSACDVLEEQRGVCRDYAHLGVALCRAMNIPARYCTGYLGDIGVPVQDPMDFSGWFEVYLGDRWTTVDPRNFKPRIGRILIARGRDAADVAMTTTFGPNVLRGFEVWAAEG